MSNKVKGNDRNLLKVRFSKIELPSEAVLMEETGISNPTDFAKAMKSLKKSGLLTEMPNGKWLLASIYDEVDEQLGVRSGGKNE